MSGPEPAEVARPARQPLARRSFIGLLLGSALAVGAAAEQASAAPPDAGEDEIDGGTP